MIEPTEVPKCPSRWAYPAIMALILLTVYLILPPALFPPCVALAVVLGTRHAVLGLALGGLSGVWILQNHAILPAIKLWISQYFFGAFSSPWHLGALIFTLLLGSFAALVEHSGGFQALVQRLLGEKHQHPKRRLQSVTMLTGILCFFDGLANAVLLGRLYRPIYDQVGVSRAKLAYLVDSTSSSVACISFISTWIATQLSLIQAATAQQANAPSAYELFLSAIPHCAYCWVSLAMAFAVVRFNWNFGPMRLAEGTHPASPTSTSSIRGATASWRALVPILVLSLSLMGLLYAWDTPEPWHLSLTKVQNAFGGKAGPYALCVGALVGLLAAWLCLPKSQRSQASEVASQGAAGMLSPLLILVLAWAFGAVMQDLGTGPLLGEFLGERLSAHWLAVGVFLLGALMSFLTGSSWGTMGLLMPIALPLLFGLAEKQGLDAASTWALCPSVIGAVFSGAVFGDHCSPFSDTTIVSALASGCSNEEHVRTQLPYAAMSAFIALVGGFSATALGCPLWLSFLLCLALPLLTAKFATQSRLGSGKMST